MKRAQKTKEDFIKKEKFIRTKEFPVLLPKNENQRLFMEALKYDSLVIASGSAGVGKTYIACLHAAKRLHEGKIKKIVLIRAYQPLAGRSIGAVPGTAQEKLMGFYIQMVEYFQYYFGKATTEIHLKNGAIEICSLETIRGRSWDDAICLCDESQNLYVQEVQALTTRLGKNSQMIFCGDDSGLQTDIKKGMTGMTYLTKIISKYNIEDTSVIEFAPADIVRSGITKSFVLAFESEFHLDKNGKGILGKQ